LIYEKKSHGKICEIKKNETIAENARIFGIDFLDFYFGAAFEKE